MPTLDVKENPTTEASPAAPTRFEDGGAMLLAGLKQRYTFQNMAEIPAQWGRFAPYIGQVPGKIGIA
ncbi:MAG TPA: AraC family transcriptional regulator, partial [Armatimonadota bacterium]|nr:AraC family transcriptional regulator [Armatimonadota bacterium]